ncbi:tyrosine-type recombinase/integrase [Pseudoflavonifractor sp. HCP28S3_F10]|uniref:tyrosine-type recombinase/integrase n=1 Tax=Pseudoflavonifractor sp. HCP28S3_F10 TaxID=3438947 RepID=UPI003F8AC154
MAKAKKRADGRYCAQIYLGRDENGKRQYKSVYARSPAELKEKETAVRLQLGRGLDVLSQRDSFSTWADDWLRLKERENITCRQMDNYRRAVRLWEDELQGYEIGQVRADDIERVLIALSDQGLSQRTISLYRSAIRQIMRRAVGRVIPTNPAEQVQLTAVGRKEEQRRALTDEEQQWIWDTPHRAQPVAVIMMLSGLRRGELAALTWNDVDLKERTITVNKVIEYDSNGVPSLRHITKTAAGMRTVDIPQRLADYMAQMPRDNVLVIHSAHGGVMTESAWVKLWRSYMRELNIKYGTRTHADLERMKSGKPGPKVFDMTIPPITMHWLRHTFCTLLYLAGVDVVQACAQMGHADVSTTLRIYTHLDAIHKRKSVDKLDSYLSGQSKVENE